MIDLSPVNLHRFAQQGFRHRDRRRDASARRSSRPASTRMRLAIVCLPNDEITTQVTAAIRVANPRLRGDRPLPLPAERRRGPRRRRRPGGERRSRSRPRSCSASAASSTARREHGTDSASALISERHGSRRLADLAGVLVGDRQLQPVLAGLDARRQRHAVLHVEVAAAAAALVGDVGELPAVDAAARRVEHLVAGASDVS